MFVEVIDRDITNRGNILPLGEVDFSPQPYERYISLFPFDEGIKEFCAINKTVAGYKGLSYCPVFYFDVDGVLADAKDAAAILATRLCNDFRVRTSDMLIYFSGAKGFHIGLSEKHFDGFIPSNDLCDRLKILAKDLSKGIPCVDLVIYEPKRIFRVPNSVNKKTGLYKIPITYDELTGPLTHILEMAKQPRILPPSVNAILPNEALIYRWSQIRSGVSTPKGEPRIEYDSNKAGYFVPTTEGGRNNSLFRQAAMLFSTSTLGRKSVTEIINGINVLSGDPLPGDEIEHLINTAYIKAHRDKRAVQEEEKVKYNLELKAVGEWGQDFLSHISPAANKLSVTPFIDHVMRHKYRGKLMIVAGFGGTKKSMFAQNIVIRNAQKHMARSIYSTMEMGSAELVGRFINMQVEPTDPDVNPTVELEEIMAERPEEVTKFFYEKIAPAFSNYILITQNGSMNASKYRYATEKAIREVGPVDILVVDGLSMMESTGPQTQSIDNHTRELKELAKDLNILVILIVHVSRSGDKTTRDLTSHARGSEKISDNCDFFISFSQVIKPEESTEKSLVYDEHLVYARVWDKRGTGITMDRILSLNPARLWLNETDLNPYEYDNLKPLGTASPAPAFTPDF